MNEFEIDTVRGRRVWDSRGRPTVEVCVALRSGVTGRAIAPAGASRGAREALDLRDGGDALDGLDIGTATRRVNTDIASELKGRDVLDQRGIDAALIALDGTLARSRLGGNAMVATSLATLHAAAAASQVPLWRHLADSYGRTPSVPLPEIQIFGGGAHAGRRVDVQDFMIMVPGASNLDEVMEVTAEVYHAAGSLMRAGGRLAGVADEGGWWPMFDSNEEALETLVRAIETVGERPGERVAISLDIAASEFADGDGYRLALEDRQLDSEALIELLGRWIDAYPIVSVEDPVAETDHAGMVEFTRRYGERVQVVGDDYLVTKAELVHEAAAADACNATLVKVNQVGTVSESIDTIEAAEAHGYRCLVSARSGETEDVSVSHLAVGLDAGQLKVGSFSRSERMAKWNECLRVQDELGSAAFVGGRPLRDTWWGQQRAGR